MSSVDGTRSWCCGSTCFDLFDALWCFEAPWALFLSSLFRSGLALPLLYSSLFGINLAVGDVCASALHIYDVHAARLLVRWAVVVAGLQLVDGMARRGPINLPPGPLLAAWQPLLRELRSSATLAASTALG